MRPSLSPLILAYILTLLSPLPADGATPYYHPQHVYVRDDNTEGIKVSEDINSGTTTQTYDAPLHKAGLAVKLRLTADEAEEECDYQITYEGRRYRFIRSSNMWSMRLDKALHLFIFDDGMAHALATTYLDKRFRFSIISMQQGTATEQQCAIIPGKKLGLTISQAGKATPDSLGLVVQHIAQRVGSGTLSAKDYSCTKARAVQSIATSRFDGKRRP